MGFTNTRKNKRDFENRDHDKYLKTMRAVRANQHLRNREKENEQFKKHYQENKDYHKKKNKEHYEANKEKWAARRAEISLEWSFNRCSPAFVESTFASLGACLKTEKMITFPQLCALITSLGYKLKDVTYPPFVRRKAYFDKKRTP